MPTIKSTINGPAEIRQLVSAGNEFSGVAPTNGGTPLAPMLEDSIYKFAAGTDGGMFNFWAALYSFRKWNALYLLSIELLVDVGTAWTLRAADPDGYAVDIKSGTGNYFCGMNATPLPYPILPKGTISLVTSGSTNALCAKLKVCHFVP